MSHPKYRNMFDIDQYIETAKNIDEAIGEDTLELLLVFSGVSVILIIAPAILYYRGSPLLRFG